MLRKYIDKGWSKVWEMLSSTRFKSFYWRFGIYVGMAAVDFTLANLANLDMPNKATILVAYILGEVSKSLNNKYRLKKG